MFKTVTCSVFRKQVELFSLGQLDPVQRGRFRNHARLCTKCAEYHEEVIADRISKEGWNWQFSEIPATSEEEWRQRHCLSDETIDEYNEDTLTDEERRLVNNHLYGEECHYCLAGIHVTHRTSE